MILTYRIMWKTDIDGMKIKKGLKVYLILIYSALKIFNLLKGLITLLLKKNLNLNQECLFMMNVMEIKLYGWLLLFLKF